MDEPVEEGMAVVPGKNEVGEMVLPEFGLTERQMKCVEVFIAKRFSVKKTCAAMNMDPRTLKDWRSKPGFKNYMDWILKDFRANAIYALPDIGRRIVEQALVGREAIIDAVLSDDPRKQIKSLSRAHKSLISEIGFDDNGRVKLKMTSILPALELAAKVCDAQTQKHLAEHTRNTFNFQLVLASPPDKPSLVPAQIVEAMTLEKEMHG